MAESPLSASLAALSRFFVGDSTVQETLQRVSDLTVDAVPAADLIGITMLVEGRPRTAIFTDETAPEVDQAQYDSGDGPCLRAFHDQRVTQIESTREPGEWPEFRATAAAHGIGSTMSFPLMVEKASVGAMNLYSFAERAFGEIDRDNGEIFAAQAAIVLANAKAYWDAQDLSRGLNEAMRNRAVIEQAKGILMAPGGVDDDDAFELLVRASQRENIKLRDVAQRIVAQAVRRSEGRPDDLGGG